MDTGIPMVQPLANRFWLQLTGTKTYSSGAIVLRYEMQKITATAFPRGMVLLPFAHLFKTCCLQEEAIKITAVSSSPRAFQAI